MILLNISGWVLLLITSRRTSRQLNGLMRLKSLMHNLLLFTDHWVFLLCWFVTHHLFKPCTRDTSGPRNSSSRKRRRPELSMTSWSQLTALSFDSPPLADPKGKRKEVYDLTEDPTPAKKRKGNDGPEASSSSSSIPNTPEDLEKLRKLEEMKVLQLWIQTSLRMSQDWLSLPCRKSLENWKMRLITPKLISVSREKRLPFMSHLRQQARSELSLIWRSRAMRLHCVRSLYTS